jgi:hypothetical protein
LEHLVGASPHIAKSVGKVGRVQLRVPSR